MLLLRIEGEKGRRYYAGYDGKSPSLRTKGAATRMDNDRAKMVLRQLEGLGFRGFEVVDESDTEKVLSL